MSPSTRVLVILTVLEVFSVAMSKGNEKRYSNSWAVEILDSREPADAVAARHGFTNRGLIGNLKNVYHFELEEGVPEESPERTLKLKDDKMIGMVEQQHYRQMVKKGPQYK